MSKKRFVFNDENVKNSYGFHILTSGINTARFFLNPVCLDNHMNWTESVIGTWENVELENGLMYGSPVFDEATENPKNKETIRKAKADILKGCSMGIGFREADFVRDPDGRLILTKCELMEVSIVAVPSNANAVQLYNSNGDKMSDDEVKTLCLSIGDPAKPTPENSLNNNEFNMKKIQLSVMAFVALGFTQNTQSVEEPELEKAVLDLKAKADKDALELDSVKKQLQAYKDAEKIENQSKIDSEVKLAIQEGRITADKEQTFKDLGVQNFELMKNTLDSFEKKVDLSGDIKTPKGKAGKEMTEEEFMKLSDAAQLSWKNENPEEYQKLFA